MCVKKKILVTTPTLTSGSWVVIENLLPFIEDKFEINIVGLGEGRGYKNVPIIKIPYQSFEKMNPKLGSNIFYNILYQIPLQLACFYKLIFFRPDIILSNGFGPLIFTLPFTIILRTKIVIYYGSHLGVWLDNKYVLLLTKILNYFIDLIFVNSVDSKNDVGRYIKKSKIVIIDHSTPFKAFDTKTRTDLRNKMHIGSDEFIVLLANRFVPAKNVPTLLKVIEYLVLNRNKNNIKFYFAGEGAMKSDIEMIESKHPENVKYLGLFAKVDKTELKEWLTIADLVWTNAETTYMSLGGVEALAMGTPIMISNEIYHQKVLVPYDLIPKKVGWVVDHTDISKIASKIAEIAASKETDRMRLDAQKYAEEKFSLKNLEKAVKLMNDIISK